MASAATHRLFLFLSVLLGFVAIAANARPCKTLIIFASTPSSFPADQNPNFPQFVTFHITNVRELEPKAFLTYKDDSFFRDRLHVPKRPTSFPSDAAVGSSIRDRTLDIMGIVVALLFGVGSGALFAGTMYLIWSLFSPKRFDYDDDSEDDYESGYDEVSAKKLGYVAVPADIAAVPPPAKQVD